MSSHPGAMRLLLAIDVGNTNIVLGVFDLVREGLPLQIGRAHV